VNRTGLRVKVAAIGLFALAGPAHAQVSASTPSEVPGVYLGGEIGRRGFDNACEPQALSCDRRGTAWGAFAGYRFDHRLAIELGYLDLGQARATYPRTTGTQQVTGDIEGFHLSGLFAVPVAQEVQLFARAGGYRWRANTRSTEFSARDEGWSATAGGGMAWRFDRSWHLRGQYLYLSDIGGSHTGRANGHIVSLGISYFIPYRP